MNLKIIIGLGLIISFLFISGCSEEEIQSLKEQYKPEIKQTVQEAVQDAMQSVNQSDNIVCNPPYMRFADNCCLDTNDNSICDNNEEVEEEEVECPDGFYESFEVCTYLEASSFRPGIYCCQDQEDKDCEEGLKECYDGCESFGSIGTTNPSTGRTCCEYCKGEEPESWCPDEYPESFEECQGDEWMSSGLKEGIHCCAIVEEVECIDGYYESFEECLYGEWISSGLKEGIHCCGEKPECPDGLKECENDECGLGTEYHGEITCCEYCKGEEKPECPFVTVCGGHTCSTTKTCEEFVCPDGMTCTEREDNVWKVEPPEWTFKGSEMEFTFCEGDFNVINFHTNSHSSAVGLSEEEINERESYFKEAGYIEVCNNIWVFVPEEESCACVPCVRINLSEESEDIDSTRCEFDCVKVKC